MCRTFHLELMHIIVESHIPFIRDVFESRGHTVDYLPPEEITNNTVRHADALIIRTRTKADAALLHGSSVKRVATATIGTDHIDMEYCRRNGIRVSNAPGCNAPAVAQYVLSSICRLRQDYSPTDITLGIVGVGHVGSIVRRWASAAGMKVMLCDPPRALAEGPDEFVTLDAVARHADIITFHTPLDNSTRHMADDSFFSLCRHKPMIINAARGPVVDTHALLRAIKDGRISDAVIDCWENETDIDLSLLHAATIATPHIASKSFEGKQRATAMTAAAIDPAVKLIMPSVAHAPSLSEISASYDPLSDTAALTAHPEKFEILRNTYDYRHEPAADIRP